MRCLSSRQQSWSKRLRKWRSRAWLMQSREWGWLSSKMSYSRLSRGSNSCREEREEALDQGLQWRTRELGGRGEVAIVEARKQVLMAVDLKDRGTQVWASQTTTVGLGSHMFHLKTDLCQATWNQLDKQGRVRGLAPIRRGRRQLRGCPPTTSHPIWRTTGHRLHRIIEYLPELGL